MAARYRKIDPRTWSDERFFKLTLEEKLIAIYAITAQSNRLGIFRFSPAMASEELAMPNETFVEGFGGVCQTLRWIFDQHVRVLYIPSWWKYNCPENPNVLKSCLADLHELPETPLLQQFADNLKYLPETFHQTFRKGLGKPSPQRMADQEQEQEQEQEQKQEQEETSASTRSAVAAATSTVTYVLVYPCTGKTQTWGLTQEQLDEFATLYPGVNVLTQCRAALGWCKSNPTKQKTTGGMMRFLNTWLAREQNKGERVAGNNGHGGTKNGQDRLAEKLGVSR